MSGSFFKELNIPSPDVNLMCGGQSEQTANIMVAFEKFLNENSKPSLVLGRRCEFYNGVQLLLKIEYQSCSCEAGIRQRLDRRK